VDTPTSRRISLRTADVQDAKKIHTLIQANLEEGHLLPRTLGELTTIDLIVSGALLLVLAIVGALSSAAAICQLIEDELEGLDVGVCLDYGHANLMGDLSDAIETVSGHLWTTHVHDNDGRNDDHRVPFAGRIDWDAAMMETQKIGYDGVLMFEVADTGDPIEVLKRTVKARERLEHMFVAF